MFGLLKKHVTRQRLLGTTGSACRARLRVEELECRLTPSAPGALSLTATPVASSQINLAWSGGSGANGYYVDEWTTSGWTQIANLGSSSTFFAVTGLNANTTYYFDVGGYNASGVTWAPNYVWATTYAGPPAAFSFTANAYSSSQINLAWNSVGGASGYYIDQWMGSYWTQVATLGAGSTGYAATGLAANSTYYFDVGAYNAYGTTWAGNWQSAKTGVFVDHPTAGAPYQPVAGSLFGSNGPSYLDVQQGAAADCWLMASLAEVAARNPTDIQNMFTYAGTTVENGSTVGLYSVRFFNTSGNPVYVTVDTELPGGGSFYDNGANGVLWVALAEKAYAQANGAGMVTTQVYGSDSYSALNGGYPTWALQAITGNSPGYYSINPTNVAAAWNAGQLIVLATGSPASPYIVPNHCYAVVGYNASSSQPFEMYNPWGTNSTGWSLGTEANGQQVYGLFTANAAFVSQNFTAQAIGTGSAAETDSISRVFSAELTGNKARTIETTSAANENLAANVVSGNTTTPTTTSVRDKLALTGFGKNGLDVLWADAGSSELSLGYLTL